VLAPDYGVTDNSAKTPPPIALQPAARLATNLVSLLLESLTSAKLPRVSPSPVHASYSPSLQPKRQLLIALRKSLGAEMKSIFQPGLVLIAASLLTPAHAADLGVRTVASPAYNWSGFYVGLNAGGHWGTDNDPAFVSADNDFGSNIGLVADPAPSKLSPKGFAGGAHLGYNWQTSNIVYGIEADFDGLTGSAERNLITLQGFDVYQFKDHASDQWMSTVRARVGLSFDRLLIFGTGGVAFSHWQTSHSIAEVGESWGGATSDSFFRTGWVAGGGFEYAIDPHWIIRGEYLHADFGTHTSNFTAGAPAFPQIGTTFVHPEKLSENIARAGVSYKFN
jgi:outer membrane immunogenic protein